MKSASLILSAALACLACSARATVVYSGPQNVAIPATLDGEYLRLSDGALSGSFPANWSTEPWLNPFFGGVDVANSPLLFPIITGSSQIVNLAPGTVIDSTGSYVTGESGSSTHVGPAANQFQIGTPGIIGFEFEMTLGGPFLFGWARMIVNNAGSGTIVDWAYENVTGTSVHAGEVPEPSAMALGLLGIYIGMSRRWRNAARQ
jgi:hypothetical protein